MHKFQVRHGLYSCGGFTKGAVCCFRRVVKRLTVRPHCQPRLFRLFYPHPLVKEFLLSGLLHLPCRLMCQGPITWRISARAEILVSPPNTKLRAKSLRRINIAHVQAHHSARAEIPFQLHEIFSDFLARLPGLKILARFEQTGLGSSARAELHPGLNPPLCNRQFDFERIYFRSRAEVSARLTGLTFQPGLKFAM